MASPAEGRAKGSARGPSERGRRERDDILLLAVTAVLVPLSWAFFLGWSSGRSVSGYDAISTLLLVVQELVASGGDWSALAYRPDLFGGMNMRDAIAPFPPFGVFARLGLPAQDVYNLSAWLVQGLLAFHGVRAAANLAAAWREGGPGLGWTERVAGVFLVGFAPALGWRFGYGHLTLLAGLLPFAVGFGLIVAAATRTATVTLVAVALLALHVGFLFTGHQIVAYGAILGAPILFGAWWSLGRSPRALVLPALVAVASLLLILPDFAKVVALATSSDSVRSLGRMSLTYGYVTERWVDWLGSLAWTRGAIPGGQEEILHHETNVPLGPLVLLLALVPWRRAHGLLIGLAATATLIVLFATNTRPVSTALLTLFPPLNSFRVPARAMLLVVFILPVLALAALAAGAAQRSWGQTAAGAALFLVLFLAPSPAREAMAWAGAAFAVVHRFRPLPWAAGLAGPGLALALAGGSLGGFRERLLPFVDVPELFARCHHLGRAVKAARSELESPLARVSLALEYPELGPNTAFASGLSSLDAYYFPPRRFLQLYFALRKTEYEPSAVFLRTPPGSPGGRALHQLFNVGWLIRAGEENQLSAQSLGLTAGAAWFSAGVRPTASMATLADELLAQGADLHTRVHEVLFIVDDDPRRPQTLPPGLDPQCASAQVLRVDAVRARPWVEAVVESPADCPLTFAMNYAETLRATATSGLKTVTLSPFPAYGTLAAVLVPRGAGTVRIEAR